jgi:PiT family inorganic phosphate transporter
MARRLTHLNPRHGLAANAGGSVMLFVASHFGIPVSTTYTIAGAIKGVGTSRPGGSVQWGKATEIVAAWVLTIPCSAALGWAFYSATACLLGPR